LALASVVVLLGGCRQVLGIEPFELADASDDTSQAPESGGADAASDIGADDASGIDAGPADTGPAVDSTPGDDSGDDSGAVDSGGFHVGPVRRQRLRGVYEPASELPELLHRDLHQRKRRAHRPHVQ
jgi:hypothetical protein